MAFVWIPVPAQVSSKFLELTNEEKKTDHAEMHVTVFFLGKNTDRKQLLLAVEACSNVAEKFQPFSVIGAMLSSFPENPDHKSGVPIIVRLISNDLMMLREHLRLEFKKLGVEYDTKFLDYKPHVTIAYGSIQLNPKPIDPIKWENSKIVISGNGSMRDQFFTEMKLGKW